MAADFHRVAIINRGEAAMRLIHAVRELNREAGYRDGAALRTIALFTEPDRRAMFVREADESIDLGSATFVDPRDGERKSRYLDYAALEQALAATRADAAWVGWGFVAEHAAFAELCRRLGIAFVGPEANIMRCLGDKIAAKHLAERIGVPVIPWSDGPATTLEQAKLAAERVGYPLVIKAAAGGGGRGIRIVRGANELGEAFESARVEALRWFGDAAVFVERLLIGAHHVEVQILGDAYGAMWAVGVRDCTVQRRHQKVIEEAPSPRLSADQDRELREVAVRIGRAVGYENAGTVEFLLERESGRFFFMEVNTRLQVEHPVTELTTGGLDLVKLQLHVARGGRLEGAPPTPRGHAIEIRLNAEDPDNQFAPAPGAIEVFRLPTGPGLRIDTGVAEGDTVPAEFDSMIVKVVAHGQTRDEALARLRRALADALIVMRSGTTNKAFLLDLLDRPEVRDATADNTWLDALAATGRHVSRRGADVALLAAGIDVYDAEQAVEKAQFYTSAARGRPSAGTRLEQSVTLNYRGNAYALRIRCLGPGRYRVAVDGYSMDLRVERLSTFERWLTCSGRRFRVVSITQGLDDLVEVDGVPHRVSRDDGGMVRSPSPAVVLSIAAEPGKQVTAGERLLVLEAMKMEMPLVAPFDGRVRQVLVSTNVQVDAGTPLVVLEANGRREGVVAADRLTFADLTSPAAESTVRDRCLANLDELRCLMLGFDVDPARVRELVAEQEALRRELAPDDAILYRAEREILSTFADLRSLFNREPAADDPEPLEARRTEEYLFVYLRRLDTQGEGLPVKFVAALKRALLHYGVQGLQRTCELEESLHRVFKSQQRLQQQGDVVVSVLGWRLEGSGEPPHAEDSFRALLDRLIAVSHSRFPSVNDLAREVRYRCFDQPLFEAARARVYEQMDDHLAHLARFSDALDRADCLEALVNCPQPLVSTLASRFGTAGPPLRELMLEVIVRRYYRLRTIEDLHCRSIGDHRCVVAQYDREGKRIHVVATHADDEALAEVAANIGPLVAEVPPEHDVVVDFYVWCPRPLEDDDSTQQRVREALQRAGFPRRIRRIVVAIVGVGPGRGMASVQHFTYRASGDGGYDGYVEERHYRGLHPMMWERLDLWRLSNFEIERLPSVEDVYLFRGVGRGNPNDERLLAIAEVRDLTPVRDSSGRIVELPHLERMLMEALAGIRQVQSHRPPHERLLWNRVLLHVWPPLDLAPDELNDIVRKLAPATEGLGIEQVVMRARIPHAETRELHEVVLRISRSRGAGLLLTTGPVPDHPLRPLSEYEQKVLRLRRRGLVYPYEIVRMLTPGVDARQADFPPGEFTEYDLDKEGRLGPVARAPGENAANVVIGVIRNFTERYPEGMSRVIVLGDPSKAMGAVAEPECSRIIAALDLAERIEAPLEWFTLSAGAKISMESGTENMDWIARVLRRLIEFTQAGGEVNVVVDGINVGAQPYWNAEATMLLHTRGILVMTPQGAMVLTGKQALDYSGSVSAEDNQGIGGYERIMGPNGQAQYWARDLAEAAQILFRHYEHTFVAPGERFPRRAVTRDPIDRDVRSYPHGGGDDGFVLVGDIFSNEKNPGRKRPFDIRRVMSAVVDQDHAPLERWAVMRDAEIAVVWDAHLGGYPACVIGIESHPVPRLGFLPADGPDHWTAGTLFPRSSKKITRALNAASGNRPVVILANLSGFDGSPESMRELQLEYGAEIGRAIVNFRGPIVFCVVSRYHGGAYVVFSGKLNAEIESAALEGSYASVIGGAPAAAVVFAADVEARARKDPRIRDLDAQILAAEGTEKARLRARRQQLFEQVHSEKLGQVADEFDKVHTVYRALEKGSIDRVIPALTLRPYLVGAVERGMRRTIERQGANLAPRLPAEGDATSAPVTH
jgi:acetyl/propionyl-CoA carboxylase alpha subunit/acetyl-CoA carboxylase carboxyltransferase component